MKQPVFSIYYERLFYEYSFDQKVRQSMLHTRTIREAAAWFKSQDPQTCLTETAIRTLLRSGRVPCVRVGKKYLVTIEALEAYLSGGATAPVNPENTGRKVWRGE